MSNLRMGRVQTKIMNVIWDKGRVNARDITETLCEVEKIAHSTVQTLLRKLEEKGSIDHDIDDRTFIFYPLVEKEKVKKHALHELADRLFAGSTGNMVSYLIKEENLSSGELKKIRDLVNEKEK